MRLDDAYVRFTVYDLNLDHESPVNMATVEGEDLEGFKRCKRTIKEYLEDYIKTFPDVPDNADITIASVIVTLTIHNPPTPDMSRVTIEIDDYDQDEGCMVKDRRGVLIFNMSEEYDDMTWRDMNRIVDRIVKINA